MTGPTAPTEVGPPEDPWTAAIHLGERDLKPVGAAVVIDECRVLTCAHVVRGPDGDPRSPLWVAFPKAGLPATTRRRVAEVVIGDLAEVADVAVLRLADPVPASVAPARLLRPSCAHLRGKRWWAFGFPRGDVLGSQADGTIGADLSYGWVRLDITSPYVVERGFSGAGLWSPDYEAVVGLVGQAREAGGRVGDGRALTLHQIIEALPDQNLDLLTRWSPEAAGEMALAAWGWHLAADPEAGRHWRPRARGVAVDSERGYRFRGRREALTRILKWLDRAEPDHRVLVVTGSPGVGKSAVLGRVVTTADEEIRGALPPEDDAVKAQIGSVACAVHAKGKTALDVAVEVARAASVALPERTEDLPPSLKAALTDRGQRFNVIIDALDEAHSPGDARTIVRDLVLPLVTTCAHVGAQVVVGTRRSDAGGDLLAAFADCSTLIDLDESLWFEEADLAAYVEATLLLVGDERRGNPYADTAVARPVAARIAALAGRNYLVGGLIARSHGLHDVEPVDPAMVAFTPTVDGALGAYLEVLATVGTVSARMMLTVLAFAEAPGLPVSLWQAGLAAFGATVSEEQLIGFAHSAAANFLVESTADPASRVYRLFHQALDDALLRSREILTPGVADERRLTMAWVELGRRIGWSTAPTYLLRSLPGHAQRAGMIDALLGDDAYLLNADLHRLLLVADGATTVAGRERARLLHMTPGAVTVGPSARAAMFDVTALLEGLRSCLAPIDGMPYRGRWVHARPREERAIFAGHRGGVSGVCQLDVSGRSLVASAGGDGTVRVWDPATGQVERILQGHTGGVNAVCQIRVGSRTGLASASGDRTIRVWDPATGQVERILQGHTGAVNAVCQIQVGERTLLASASSDATVRLWDPATVQAERILEGHGDCVYGVCTIQVAGQSLLASASGDCTVRIWDPAANRLERVLEGHTNAVNGVGQIQVGLRRLLASAGDDRTIRIWNPATGEVERIFKGHTGGISGVCQVQIGQRKLLASASRDRTVRVWDPASGRPGRILAGHTSSVNAVCQVKIGARNLLASGSNDSMVGLWDPAARQAERPLDEHTGAVNGVCAIHAGRRTLIVSGGTDGTIRVWDLVTGRAEQVLEGHTGSVNAVCQINIAQRALLASASDDGTIRLWDTATGRIVQTLAGQSYWVRGVCQIRVGDRNMVASATGGGNVQLWNPTTGLVERVLTDRAGWFRGLCEVRVGSSTLLATASIDGTIRLWDPVAGRAVRTLSGHTAWVWGICEVRIGGRSLLGSASGDGTVRLWDPTSGQAVTSVVVHRQATACVYAEDLLVIGLDAGLVAIELHAYEGFGGRSFSDLPA